MSRAGRALALAASATGAFTVALTLVSIDTARPRVASADAPAALTLVSQEFDLTDLDPFAALVALPDDLHSTDLIDGSMVVTSYARVSTRTGVAEVVSGTLTRAVDRVVTPLSAVLQPDLDQYLVSIPTEAVDRTAEALQFSRPGIYPITIEVQRNDSDHTTVASVTTFVHRIIDSAATPDEPTLTVTAAMTTDSRPVAFTATNNDRVLDVVSTDAAIATYGQLADILEASPLSIAVRMSPAQLTALRRDDRDDTGATIAERLSAAFDHHLLLSATDYPLDPSAAAAAGQQALYTQWYRNGEDALGRVVTSPSIRTVAFIDQPLSAGGGELYRDLGTRLAVITPAQLDALPDSLGAFTDTTRLVDITVAPDVVVPTAVVDRTVSQHLDHAAADPTLNAIQTVADLIATRDEIVDADGDPSRHVVVLATSDLTMPDTDTLLAIADLIATTTGLEAIDLDQVVSRIESAQRADDAAPVHLPDTTDGTIAGRIDLAAELSTAIDHVASMLPTTGDAAPTANTMTAGWRRLVSLLPSSALTDTQADTIATTIDADLAAIRDAVVLPAGFSFTLTGRTSNVPIKLTNTSDMPLTVQLRVTSLKLLFPEIPMTVTLEPGQFTEVLVKIEARTNGKSPVTLEVYTPDSGLRLGPPVPLSAQVTALSGLGPFVTGAFIIVLLTWWGRHVRQKRRAAASQLAAQRHPGAGPASTLPPS